ncbi:hypothetical protein BD626DRAFT_513236 [Schizophyllum amplum]|uniref:Uncharacterized protein n=1 Tax=Schizophyllum amplum TaxID=97359 RepID=A0A550BZB8_9AGAR|nr:hypothetical protein BD626DRAFT_513236 [Auriculariopsis ampla]
MPIQYPDDNEYTRHEARGKLFKLTAGRYAEQCAGTMRIVVNKQDKTAGRLVMRESGTDIIMLDLRIDMVGKACLGGADDRWVTLETDDDYCDEEQSYMFKILGTSGAQRVLDVIYDCAVESIFTQSKGGIEEDALPQLRDVIIASMQVNPSRAAASPTAPITPPRASSYRVKAARLSNGPTPPKTPVFCIKEEIMVCSARGTLHRYEDLHENDGRDTLGVVKVTVNRMDPTCSGRLVMYRDIGGSVLIDVPLRNLFRCSFAHPFDWRYISLAFASEFGEKQYVLFQAIHVEQAKNLVAAVNDPRAYLALEMGG